MFQQSCPTKAQATRFGKGPLFVVLGLLMVLPLSADVALGGLDGDGNLDAVFANNGTNRVCFGNGLGGFTSCSDVSTDTNLSRGVALGFVDGDTTLDAVFANFAQKNRVCFGNGLGGFTSCSDVSTDTNDSSRVARRWGLWTATPPWTPSSRTSPKRIASVSGMGPGASLPPAVM